MAAVTFIHRGGSRIEAGINRRQAFIASLGNSGRHEKRQSCIQAITCREDVGCSGVDGALSWLLRIQHQVCFSVWKPPRDFYSDKERQEFRKTTAFSSGR